jgi:1-acyl-sn-glycerol-3-phosphate acyltransferase
MLPPPAPPPPLPFRLVYACFAWPVFLLLAAASLPVLLTLPGLPRRRRLIRGVAATALRCIGMRVRATGIDTLPHPCVVIANHESYLDGVVLAATLPADFGFVIKREMRAVPAAGWLLERIGAHFVARGSAGSGAGDARRVLRQAEQGEALVFFPEGTFHHQPGLLPFRNGAFAAAQRAGLPLVPLIIRGTRRCLAPGTLAPWPGGIDVTVLAPLHATLPGADGVAALRDSARALFIENLES